MSKEEQILNIFKLKGGVVKLEDITNQGINKYHLLKLVDSGEVDRIQHGVYKLVNFSTHEFIEIKKIIPKGVVCLYSAWNYYELTTYIPHEYHVAIEKKSKIKLPDYPPIKLYYWENSILKIGITQEIIDNVEIEIYDIEKSVCDTIKFRNKIGKDILNEVLTNYLKRSDKNIDKLIKYAKQLRVETILKNYLDVLM